MTKEFCTIFDKTYLIKGLALYNSLTEHCKSFRLWILCMDNSVYQILKKLDLKNATLVTLQQFEDPELLSVKKDKNAGEYCWTCKPSFMLYILNKSKNTKHIIYIDTDCFFYSPPEPIYEELGDNSILLTPHRFLPHKKHLEKSGIYNAGFFMVKNDII